MPDTITTAAPTSTDTENAPAEPTTNETGRADADGSGETTFDNLLSGNKSYQAEFDRRVSKALNTAKSQWQRESEAQVQQARTEAEKLAKMTADQRAAHEREQRETDYANRLKDLTRRELRAQAIDTLAERGLSPRLADTLNYADAEACKASLEAVEAAYRESVEAGVKDRLRGTAPKAGTPTNASDAGLRRAMGLPETRK
ncbi:phage scaffold protein [Clostridia bacterium]|nr:phage scaffold protein [Clostridia bacterium]